MICFNYTFSHDIYNCTNTNSNSDFYLIVIYCVFAFMTIFKDNVNKLIKNFDKIDTINLLLENVFIYIKMARVFDDYDYPLFFEFSKINWILTMLAFGCISWIVIVDAGYQPTFYKPLLFLMMCITPSLGMNYNIIQSLVKLMIVLLPTQIKYKNINILLTYKITNYPKLKFIFELMYFISHYIVSLLMAYSIISDDLEKKILYITTIHVATILLKY